MFIGDDSHQFYLNEPLWWNIISCLLKWKTKQIKTDRASYNIIVLPNSLDCCKTEEAKHKKNSACWFLNQTVFFNPKSIGVKYSLIVWGGGAELSMSWLRQYYICFILFKNILFKVYSNKKCIYNNT